MKMLIRTSPLTGESFSSYLQRLSKLNYVSPYDIWRLLIKPDSHYPQSSFSSALDICPNSYIELNNFASTVDLDKGSIENLTFIPVFEKLGINKGTIPHSRVLNYMTEKHRKFCPKCLEENPYYKLIWQVQEVIFCPIHLVELQFVCNRCGKSIPVLPSNSEIGICPNCNGDLRQVLTRNYKTSLHDERIIEDWTYLLDKSSPAIKPLKDFSNQQILAIRLLFTSRNQELTPREKTTLSSILQIAKETKTTQTFIHLKTILHFVRKYNTSLEKFLTMEIPQDYISALFAQKSKLVDVFSCQAPWCHSYQIPGSLKRTSTSIKKLNSGQEQKYYMFCKDCGIEYGLNTDDNKIIERGYFINFAWYRVKNELSMAYSFAELAKKLNSTEDKLKRSIIFLFANNLVEYNQLPFEVPPIHDPETLSAIEDNIRQGIPAKQIRRKLGLKYNQFLFYWLSAEARKACLTYSSKRPEKKVSVQERTLLFEQAVNSLVLKNKPITIKGICIELGICPETLRNWSLLQKIKAYKAEQNKQRQEKYATEILKKTDAIFSEQNGTPILSEEFYRLLGVRRTVLVRKYPQLTQYIHSKLCP